MAKKVLLALLVALVGLLAYAATRPDTFTVTRSATIQAGADRVYARLQDFGPDGWRAWSPWEKRDPNLKRRYSGPAAGKGAVYAWDGNDQVGAGRMEIVEAAPPGRLAIQLDFDRPMQTRNRAEFTLTPAGSATTVQWTMSGPNNYVSKLMQVFFDLDALIGKDFEDGLQNLKGLAEK